MFRLIRPYLLATVLPVSALTVPLVAQDATALPL